MQFNKGLSIWLLAACTRAALPEICINSATPKISGLTQGKFLNADEFVTSNAVAGSHFFGLRSCSDKVT